MLSSFLNRFGYMPASMVEQKAEQMMREKYPEWYLAYAKAHEYDVPPPETYEAQADLMAKVSYLYTVITLTAQSAASQDFDIYNRVDDTELENHELEMLMKSPNPLQTGFEFLRDHFIYKLLNGSSYWWLNIVPGDLTPSEIWLIPPGNIMPIPDEKLGIKGYNYYPGDGQEIYLGPKQIIWFRGFHPSNLYASLSGLVPLARTMQTDINTQKFLQTVYGPNSGRLPGIIAFKSPVGDEDWKAIKKDIRAASTEGNYMMLRGVGDGVSWLQAAATLKEMETMQGRKMTKEDIYDTFAPGLLNMTSVSATEANATTGKKTFAEFTLFPLLTDMQQKVNKDLAPYYGEIKIEFDDPRDLSQQAEAAKMTLETQRVSIFTGYASKLPVELAAELADLQLPDGMSYADLETPTTVPTQLQPYAGINAPPQSQPNYTPPAQPAQDENMIAAEMAKWQAFEHKHAGKGRQFECKIIPPALQLRIRASLKAGTDIDSAFALAGKDVPTIILANAINKAANNG